MENKAQIILSTDNLYGVVEMERLYYETQARLNVINVMIQQDMADTDMYKKYWEEYLSYLKTYEEFKDIFTQKNGLDKYENKSWRLDFANSKIILE